MQTEVMIAVRDVQQSARWYCELLGATHDHDGPDFDRILSGQRVLLMLHRWGAHEHGAMISPHDGVVGNGVMIWVYLDDLEATFQRASKLGARVLEAPHFNPQAQWREFSVQDLNGYALGIAER